MERKGKASGSRLEIDAVSKSLWEKVTLRLKHPINMGTLKHSRTSNGGVRDQVSFATIAAAFGIGYGLAFAFECRARVGAQAGLFFEFVDLVPQ